MEPVTTSVASQPPSEITGRQTGRRAAGPWASMWGELKNPRTVIEIIGIIIGITGIVIAIILYVKGEKYGEISMYVDQIQIFDKTRSGVVPLTVLDSAGRTIDNNVYVASAVIWNSGNAEIKREDVRQPFRLTIGENATKVIDIAPILFTRDNIDGFSVNRNTGEITWQHFDAGEGLKIKIIYASPIIQGIQLSGYAVGTELVDNQERERRRKELNSTIEHVAGILSVIVVSGFILGIILYRRRQSIGSRIVVYTTIVSFAVNCSIVVMWIVFTVASRGPGIPPSVLNPPSILTPEHAEERWKF